MCHAKIVMGLAKLTVLNDMLLEQYISMNTILHQMVLIKDVYVIMEECLELLKHVYRIVIVFAKLARPRMQTVE